MKASKPHRPHRERTITPMVDCSENGRANIRQQRGGQTIDVPLKYGEAPATSAIFHIELKLIAVFFVGCVGGTTFSIKWLIHSVAKLKWHLDRRYWRMF
eukprot:gene293-331_t